MSNISRARNLRQKATWAERLMWKWLRDRRFSTYKFRRQHPLGIYTLDFYCNEAKLSIELDGGGHGFPEKQQQDAIRTTYLNSLGIKELRFWNSYMREHPQSVRDTIFNELQWTATLCARWLALTLILSPGRRKERFAIFLLGVLFGICAV